MNEQTQKQEEKPTVGSMLDQELKELETKVKKLKKETMDLINRLRDIKKAKEYYSGVKKQPRKKPIEKK